MPGGKFYEAYEIVPSTIIGQAGPVVVKQLPAGSSGQTTRHQPSSLLMPVIGLFSPKNCIHGRITLARSSLKCEYDGADGNADHVSSRQTTIGRWTYWAGRFLSRARSHGFWCDNQ